MTIPLERFLDVMFIRWMGWHGWEGMVRPYMDIRNFSTSSTHPEMEKGTHGEVS